MSTMIYYIIHDDGKIKKYYSLDKFRSGLENYEVILDFYRELGYGYFDIEEGSSTELKIQNNLTEWLNSCATKENKRYNDNGFHYGSKMIEVKVKENAIN